MWAFNVLTNSTRKVVPSKIMLQTAAKYNHNLLVLVIRSRLSCRAFLVACNKAQFCQGFLVENFKMQFFYANENLVCRYLLQCRPRWLVPCLLPSALET